MLLAVLAAMTGSVASAAADRPAEITVGYFQQWPSPSQFAQEKKTFDYALGVRVNWVAFGSANEMNSAMASGAVQIAYSQGHVPFLVGVSGGLDLTMVGIAVSQPENDNCILRNDAGITRDNLAQLAGHKIATRLGSVSHFRLLKLLERLDIDQSRIEIVASADGASAAQALQQGDVVMACAAGSSLRRMAEYGQPLLSGAELESIGLRLFDAITVPTVFMDEHPEIVQAFVDIIEASNQQWRKNPGPMRAAIARAANMHQEASDRAMQGFSFPLNQEQKSAAWLGDAVPVYLQELADFFVKQGQLDKAMESYEPFITTRFLR